VEFFKHSAGLSFQCAIALTPLVNTLVIDGEFFSCSVDTGFVPGYIYIWLG